MDALADDDLVPGEAHGLADRAGLDARDEIVARNVDLLALGEGVQMLAEHRHVQTGGGKGRAGGVLSGKGQRRLQRAVAAHGGAHDKAVSGAGGHPEHIPDGGWQLPGEIGEKAVAVDHIGVKAALGVGQHEQHVIVPAPVRQHGVVQKIIRPALEAVEEIAHLSGRLPGEVVGRREADGGLHIQRLGIQASL